MRPNIWILTQPHQIQITNPDQVLFGDKNPDFEWSHWLSLCRRVVCQDLETLRQSELQLTSRWLASVLKVEKVLFPHGEGNKNTKPFHLFFT